MSGVETSQRHTRAHRCPVCDGADGDPRGQGKRCSGFTSSDGEYAHCSREELAGSLAQEDGGTYAHRLRGPCKCGTTHGEGGRSVSREVVATYVYESREGVPLFRVVRTAGKDFYQQHPDGGAWASGRNGTAPTLYRLRQLVEDDADRTVYVVEGEKDVETLEKRGYLATTNPGGAGKWHYVTDVAKTVLQGRDVIVVADDDEPGRKHALDVAASLRGVARSLRVVRCPRHKDVSDHLGSGGGLDELVPLGDTPKPGPSFAVKTGADIWAPLEPPQYLIEPIFVRGALGLIVAYGASLKTWIELDGAMSVQLGEQWLMRFASKQGRSLLIDFESGDYELRRRLQKLARGRTCATPLDGLGYVSMPEYSLVNDEFFEALRPLAKSHDFIGIDSLAAGSPGVDENDARFATSLQRLKAIAATTGCVIVVLHHSRKGGGEDGDEREMVRGSSAIFNACDVVLQLRRFNDEGAFVMRQTKARGGKSIEPVVVQVTDTEGDGAVVRARDVGDLPENDAGASRAIERAKRAIVALLGSEPQPSKSAIYRRIGGTKKTKLEALDELLEQGSVRESDGAFRLGSEVRA